MVVNNPVLALLSALVPGGGQVAKGQFIRALLIWIIMVVSVITIIGPVIVYFWQIYDAGK